MTETPLLRVEGLARHFALAPPLLARLLKPGPAPVLKAVDGVDFAIPRGKTFGLVGESGCGKSTVARLAVGLERPSGGRVLFDGIDLAGLRGRRAMAPLRRRWQMIFQDPYASLNPRWRVADIIAEPIRAHGSATDRRHLRRRVEELLAQVRLSPRDAEKFPHAFSGGQRQRIAIARALASRPEFLVCDEPTSALDVSVQAQVLNLLRAVQRDLGLACLFISHDLAVISHVADEVGVMYLGRLVERGPAAGVFAAPRHPYTRLLLDALPDLKRAGPARPARSQAVLPGGLPDEPASPLAPPAGCAFHPRCPLATARCRQEPPRPRPRAPADPSQGEVACHAVEEGRVA